MANKIMTVDQFIDKLNLALACKTLYVKGCFGAPLNAKNKKRYTTNLTYNKNRAWIINAATDDTYGFDCVNLVKGILFGWCADKNLTYGGAVYGANGVPDINADSMITKCEGVTSDFSNIVKGEFVWMQGHCGIYIGNGEVIECTPRWSNNVQVSNCGNVGNKSGHYRMWTKHGKLPWIDYSAVSVTKPVNGKSYTVVKGDTLSKIGKKTGLKWQDIATKNGIKFPYIIRVGQILKL